MSAGETTQGAWWGWGAGKEVPVLSDQIRELIAERFGPSISRPAAAVKPSEIDLPDARRLPGGLSSHSRALLDVGPSERLRHALGMSYPDLIRLRSGDLATAPDAVAFPRTRDQVSQLLAECARAGIAVVPFGGGTSVVGGVTPNRGSHDAVVSLDLGALDSLAIDAKSNTSRMEPGLLAPQAEKDLRRQGFTLGHFPQSFERASIGGFAATRSAGQASSGLGRFDDLVTSIELATPSGTLGTLESPHTAAGPSLRELVVGSEGALGVITQVTCAIRPAPKEERYQGWVFEGFEAGCDAVRRLAQADALPDVIRVSDEQETEIGFSTSSSPERIKTALNSYLSLRGKRNGSLMICGWQGERDSVSRRSRAGRRILREAGGMSLGTAPGKAWERHRFDGPYLRDHLIDQGVLVETLETSHTWSELTRVHRSVSEALRVNLGPSAVIMCHLSHAYRDGASLYFTFLSPVRPGDEIETWHRAKSAACDAIVAAGATITHHHAVGRDHQRWMQAEVGQLGLDVLASIKDELDPTGIMNPGVLLPAAD